jgi:hypothetical protein
MRSSADFTVLCCLRHCIGLHAQFGCCFRPAKPFPPELHRHLYWNFLCKTFCFCVRNSILSSSEYRLFFSWNCLVGVSGSWAHSYTTTACFYIRTCFWFCSWGPPETWHTCLLCTAYMPTPTYHHHISLPACLPCLGCLYTWRTACHLFCWLHCLWLSTVLHLQLWHLFCRVGKGRRYTIAVEGYCCHI